MSRIKSYQAIDAPSADGTSLKGYIRAYYTDLVNVLGEPVYTGADPEDKVKVEWICSFRGDVFTVYDWKTCDLDYTMNKLKRFNVGSKVSAYDFIEELESSI